MFICSDQKKRKTEETEEIRISVKLEADTDTEKERPVDHTVETSKVCVQQLFEPYQYGQRIFGSNWEAI